MKIAKLLTLIFFTVLILQFISFFITGVYLAFTNGYHSICPHWFNMWGFFGLLLPFMTGMIAVALKAIYDLWTRKD